MVPRRSGCSSASSVRPGSAPAARPTTRASLANGDAPRPERRTAPGAPHWLGRGRPRPETRRRGGGDKGSRRAKECRQNAHGLSGKQRSRPRRHPIAGVYDRNRSCDSAESNSREEIRSMQDRCVMLRAVNPDRNVNRSWVCRIERDLFGACVVSVTFGRAGTKGRTIRRTVSDDAEADRFLARAMARRRGSVKRCGAAYRIIEVRGFDRPLGLIERETLWRGGNGAT